MSCITNQDQFKLQGDFYSEVFSYIEIKLKKCLNTTSTNLCKSEEEIDNYFRYQSLSLAMINSYFDYSDFNRRDLKSIKNGTYIDQYGLIRQYIDDRFFIQIEG
jgi:hypothetical protein